MVATILTVVFSHISYMVSYNKYWLTVDTSECEEIVPHAGDPHLDYVGRIGLYRGFRGLYGAHRIVVNSHGLATAY